MVLKCNYLPITAFISTPITMKILQLRKQVTRLRPLLSNLTLPRPISAVQTRFRSSQTGILAVYLVLSLVLTLHNKIVIDRVQSSSTTSSKQALTRKIQFPYPFLLTAVHAAASQVGTALLLSLSFFQSTADHLVLTGSRDHAYALLYIVNISLSNASLRMVTVPFHQVIRSTTPVFTIAIQRLFLGTSCPSSIYASLVPVVVGVMLTTDGEYNATMLGIILTFTGAFSAALKAVITNRFMKGSSPLHLLHRISGLACIYALIVAWVNGELMMFWGSVSRAGWQVTLTCLLINGTIAFVLNVASFVANAHIGPLAMTVAANLKQASSVILAVSIWDIRIKLMQVLGIALTFAGGIVFALAKGGK